MLHPDVILKHKSISGKGLFAKKKIPKGTIVYRTRNDIRIYTKKQYNGFSKKYRDILLKFANEDNGRIIHHVDNAKYGNHSCEPNVHLLPSGIDDIDITLRDIEKGEELTWDYGTLILPWKKPFRCNCKSKNCRGRISRLSPNSKISIKLELLAMEAGKNFSKVKQSMLNREEFVKLAQILHTQS